MVPTRHTDTTVQPGQSSRLRSSYIGIGTVLALAGMAILSPPVGTAETAPVANERSLPAVGRPTTANHPLVPVLKIARDLLAQSRERLRDYTAVVVKRERIKGRLGEHQFIETKVRNRKEDNRGRSVPLSVYLKFRKPKSVAGREVIWVEGENHGRLVAHEGGFKNLLTVKLKPSNPLAMFGQRYPITDLGIENLLLKLIERGEGEMRHGECDVQIIKDAKVSGRTCTLIQVEHPMRPHFDFYRARIFIDDEHALPIRYAAWTWPKEEGGEPVLEEEYTYQKLRLNVGLTDKDFDPENSEYNFP